MLLIFVEILSRGFTLSPCSITAIFFHKFRSYAPKNRLNVNLITISNLVYRSILLLVILALLFKVMGNTVSLI